MPDLMATPFADPRGEGLPQLGAQDSVAWLVGPEGGFAAEEVAELERDLGAVQVALGRHVLRFETAAMARIPEPLPKSSMR